MVATFNSLSTTTHNTVTELQYCYAPDSWRPLAEGGKRCCQSCLVEGDTVHSHSTANK